MSPGDLDTLCGASVDALVPAEGGTIFAHGTADYRIDHETGCWEWLKTKLDGYGMAGKYGRAARAYYKLAHGIDHLPGSIHVHHRCHNPGCVNPEHLQLVPHAAHLKHHKRAASHHTLEVVLDIRHRAAAGDGPCKIARDMNLHEDAVEDIVAGRTWADAGGPIGVPPRDCGGCGKALPADRRRNRKYCDHNCNAAAHRARERSAA